MPTIGDTILIILVFDISGQHTLHRYHHQSRTSNSTHGSGFQLKLVEEAELMLH